MFPYYLSVVLIFIILWFLCIKFLLLSSDNWRDHIGFLYIATILLIYWGLTPLYGVFNGWFEQFNNNIEDYFIEVIILYMLAFFSLTVGYFLGIHKQKKMQMHNINIQIPVNIARFWIIAGFLCVFIWGYLSGFSIKRLLFLSFFVTNNKIGSETTTGMLSYFNLAFEFVIPGLVFAYFSTMNRVEFSFWLILFCIITFALGFRYRLIIIFSVFFLLHVYQNKLNNFKLIKFSCVCISFVLVLAVIGDFRSDIKSASKNGISTVSSIEIESSNYKNLGSIFKYTNNYLTDMSLVKYMNENNIEYGMGESIFGHVFIRILPASLFGGSKPYPPSIDAVRNSWNNLEGYYAGAAISVMCEFYFAGGYVGVFLLSVTLGWLISNLRKLTYKQNGSVLMILITCSLFHYVTRGYLAGFLMSFLFILIPVFHMKLLSKSKSKSKVS